MEIIGIDFGIPLDVASWDILSMQWCCQQECKLGSPSESKSTQKVYVSPVSYEYYSYAQVMRGSKLKNCIN